MSEIQRECHSEMHTGDYDASGDKTNKNLKMSKTNAKTQVSQMEWQIELEDMLDSNASIDFTGNRRSYMGFFTKRK